jgi:hypothetical protein
MRSHQCGDHLEQGSRQETVQTKPSAKCPHQGARLAPGAATRQTAANARSKYESHVTMARDAASRGDTIEAENLYQHAEHYYRVLREPG